MDFSQCIDCPPSPLTILCSFGVGAVLVALTLAARRRLNSVWSDGITTLLFAAAVLWNCALVFVFVYPHNHHVIYLASHRASLIANQAVGVVWGILVAVAFWRWWRPRRRAA